MRVKFKCDENIVYKKKYTEIFLALSSTSKHNFLSEKFQKKIPLNHILYFVPL